MNPIPTCLAASQSWASSGFVKMSTRNAWWGWFAFREISRKKIKIITRCVRFYTGVPFSFSNGKITLTWIKMLILAPENAIMSLIAQIVAHDLERWVVYLCQIEKECCLKILQGMPTKLHFLLANDEQAWSFRSKRLFANICWQSTCCNWIHAYATTFCNRVRWHCTCTPKAWKSPRGK